MNTKHSFWNRLFAALLLAVMLVTQTTTAFAVEDSPEPTEPSMVQAQDSDTGTEEAGEGTDTPEGGSLSEGPETALQTVSSLEELLQAIEQAEAGATVTPYLVRVKITNLNIRKGPGTNYGATGYIQPGIYTIVAESTGKGAAKWGKLKSGAGWISLDYATKT